MPCLYDVKAGEWVELPDYEGSPCIDELYDNRKRPMVWTKRHCRTYDDPWFGSSMYTHDEYLTVVDRKKVTKEMAAEYFHLGWTPPEFQNNSPLPHRPIKRRTCSSERIKKDDSPGRVLRPGGSSPDDKSNDIFA